MIRLIITATLVITAMDIDEICTNVKFPADFKFSNCTAQTIALPEVGVTIKGNSSELVTVPDRGALCRVVSSIIQIAKLNKFDETIKLEHGIDEVTIAPTIQQETLIDSPVVVAEITSVESNPLTATDTRIRKNNQSTGGV